MALPCPSPFPAAGGQRSAILTADPQPLGKGSLPQRPLGAELIRGVLTRTRVGVCAAGGEAAVTRRDALLQALDPELPPLWFLGLCFWAWFSEHDETSFLIMDSDRQSPPS